MRMTRFRPMKFALVTNDTLAAMVAGQVHADLLIILTDQQGMFDFRSTFKSRR